MPLHNISNDLDMISNTLADRFSQSIKWLLTLLVTIGYLSNLSSLAQTPAQCDIVYAVHDRGVQDSQIFTYDLNTQDFAALGPLHAEFDLEGFDVHPVTRVLYTSSGQRHSQLYSVDAVSGDLLPVGAIGFDNVTGLAFHPNGQLWAGSDQGLLQIDVATAAGVVIDAVLPGTINSLAWNSAGTQLFATIDEGDSSTLWVYAATAEWQQACTGLPPKVESLATLPDGDLIYAFHQDDELAIHTFEMSSCQTLSDATLNTPYNDIEGIAWAAFSCTVTNADALRAYLAGLEGVTQVEMPASGAIAVTLNGEVHTGQLAATVVAGEPPADGTLLMEPTTDHNGDGIADFQVTYPSGDRQVIYYFGVEQATPQDCQTLTAPTLDPTVISIPSLVTQFLYSGDNPIQTGVAEGVIDLERAATLRGLVTDANDQPLPNVTVTLKNHPEYGQTVTTCDGYFNMAVNGGATLTVEYQKAGYLPVQRKISAAWQEYAVVDTVVLLALDPQVTQIELGANQPLQAASGGVMTDADGSRQAVVLFPQGVTATMTLPDGRMQALTELNVRATEYTVGENGPAAMPGPLPAASGYTYAVDLTVDEALAAGATQVNFSAPVPLYVDNFLDFPVGGIVPVGWYDYARSVWVPSDNGVVIGILAVENGLAVLDVEGNGVAANAAVLAELGISAAERAELANRYPVGKSLWRSPIPHFTPWDCNWPYGPPDDAERYSGDEPETEDEDNPDEPCEESGCIIEAENQVLGERLPVVGTPFSLNYRSNRVPGYKKPYNLKIPLRGDSVPDSLNHIILEINIAGRRFVQNFSPSAQATHFVWDGLDLFGRQLQGRQTAEVRIGYVYKPVYQSPSEFMQSFARLGDEPISGGRGQAYITLWKQYIKAIGTHHPVDVGLGQFNLSVHHTYDAINHILYRGNGKQRHIDTIMRNAYVETVASRFRWPSAVFFPHALAFSPEGELHILDQHNNVVRRLNSRGFFSHVVGSPRLVDRTGRYMGAFGGDGGLATKASLNLPMDITFDTEGNLYIADYLNSRVRRVNPDGIIETIAGGGNHDLPNSDGQLATEIFIAPRSIAVSPDGELHIAERNRILRVDANGIIHTVAGVEIQGSGEFSGDAGLATAAHLAQPNDIEFSPDGSLYIADQRNNRVRRIDTNGIIHTVAGNGNRGTHNHSQDFFDGGKLATEIAITPYHITIAPDGSLYISDNYYHIYRVNNDGIIHLVAGKRGTRPQVSHDSLVFEVALTPKGIAFSPDNSLHIADEYNSRVRRINKKIPKFSLNSILVSSENGALLYEFTPMGRHLRTFDTLTAQTLYTFAYTNNGYLDTITDLDGDVTRIERNGDAPVAIIAPDGQRTALTLDANGYLNSIANPAGETHQLNYTEDGLLTEFTNPRGHTATYRYDAQGAFIEDINPAGGGWTVARTDHDEGGYTATLTSKEGRATQYKVESKSNGDVLRVQIAPDGTKTESLIKANGTTELTSPDGTQVVSQQAPDPRFGMQAPYTETMTITTPSGLSSEVVTEKTVALINDDDPLSLKTLTTKVTMNGRTSSSIYKASDKKVVATSPEKRQTISYFDNKGRLIRDHISGLADINYRYDSRGRLVEIREGEGTNARIDHISYNQQGYIAQITDAENRTESYLYDAVGRVLTEKLRDGREISYQYDDNGNLIALKPPARPEHRYTYDVRDMQTRYDPPDVGLSNHAEVSSYNLDDQLTHITRPDNTVIELNYDSAGRLTELLLPKGSQTLSFYETNGQLHQVFDSYSNSRLDYAYDGNLLLSEQWSGVTDGIVKYRYNNDFRIETTQVNQLTEIAFQYDKDGLLTQVGELALSRNPDNGMLTGTQLGNVSTVLEYNEFGETIREVAKYQNQVLYEATYLHDKLGRITRKTETILGATTVSIYQYDLGGRLITVTVGGADTTYDYDANSNRTHVNNALVAHYDNQDRLLQYANTTYAYTANGELQRKTLNGKTTEYQYDTANNLLQVQQTNQTIEYVVDANDRRIGKKINGVLQYTLLYQGPVNPVAMFDSNGQLLGQYVYATVDNMPDYVIANGITYRYITDHLGSVVLLVDVVTGSILQRSNYDAWGNMQRDVELVFQPFGFAGGLYDADTELLRFGARDYAADIGRWTTQDPIGHASQAVNLYAYVYNDPINNVDASGLFIPYLVACLGRGAGMELMAQLVWEGRSIECIDWQRVLSEGMGNCNPFSLLRKLGIIAKAPMRYKMKPQDMDWRGTGKTYRDALDAAFEQTGFDKSEFKVTKWGLDANGKSIPVEYRHKSGAEVNIDLGHAENGPDVPHVGWQKAGKRGSGGGGRGHIMLDSVPVNRNK